MTNLEYFDRFDQSRSSEVNKLFWIATSFSNSDFKDLLDEMEDRDFEQCFPDIYDSKYYKKHAKDRSLIDLISSYRKFGLLAEIHIPHCDNFSFLEGRPVSWSVHQGSCRVECVYAETLEMLMQEIEKVSMKVFQEFVYKEQKKIASAKPKPQKKDKIK